jgi:hypothetical protein
MTVGGIISIRHRKSARNVNVQRSPFLVRGLIIRVLRRKIPHSLKPRHEKITIPLFELTNECEDR